MNLGRVRIHTRETNFDFPFGAQVWIIFLSAKPVLPAKAREFVFARTHLERQ